MERKVIAEKEKKVEKLAEKLEKANSFYIVDYTGLDANTMNDLRGKFKSKNFEYLVIKNSILERASEKLGFEEIKEVLAGPNSISISYDDPIGPARIINDQYKETELPVVKLCFIEGKWFTPKEVKRLADLPPREVLVGQLLNLMVSPMSRFVGLAHNLISGLVRVVDGIREKKQAEEHTAPPPEEKRDGEKKEEAEKKEEPEEREQAVVSHEDKQPEQKAKEDGEEVGKEKEAPDESMKKGETQEAKSGDEKDAP